MKRAHPRMSGIAGLLRFDGNRSRGTTSNAWPMRSARTAPIGPM